MADKLVKAATISIGVREGARVAKSRLLRLIGELEFYQLRLLDVESELEAVMDKSEHSEILRSMKGIERTILLVKELGEID